MTLPSLAIWRKSTHHHSINNSSRIFQILRRFHWLSPNHLNMVNECSFGYILSFLVTKLPKNTSSSNSNSASRSTNPTTSLNSLLPYPILIVLHTLHQFFKIWNISLRLLMCVNFHQTSRDGSFSLNFVGDCHPLKAQSSRVVFVIFNHLKIILTDFILFETTIWIFDSTTVLKHLSKKKTVLKQAHRSDYSNRFYIVWDHNSTIWL